jgi:predicted DNA-binding transcriptional regulator AlpA
MRPSPPHILRLVSESEAARYCGVSRSTFRKRWQQGQAPEPIRNGRRILWDLRRLDRHIDALSGFGGEGQGSSWDDV